MLRRSLPLLVVLALPLAGCRTARVLSFERVETLTGLDFRPFSERGFLMTPYAYEGAYEPRGEISLEILPSASREWIRKPRAPRKLSDWTVERVTAAQGLQRAYEEAQRLGADALVDVKVALVPVALPVRREPSVLVVAVRVSGFAVKRL